jgi:hypothetical protein
MLPVLAGPLTALAGEGAMGLVGAAGQAIASAVDPAAIAYRKQMKKDMDALQRGKLGLSEAEKRTMLAGTDRKSTRLNSSHMPVHEKSRMPSSA